VVSDAIIGAGVTGLAAGMVSGAPVFEQADGPGGICSSYYRRRGDPTVHPHAPPEDDAYRFEVGGGHWIFGGAPDILEVIERLAPTRTYQRRASVRIGATAVPYPLQEHVDRLGPDVARRVAEDRQAPAADLPDDPTLRQWLRASFGPTLDDLFFAPFNDRYTAGLAGMVAAQDAYKSPVPAPARPGRSSSGYNAEFRYPAGGLDALVGAMAARSDVRYGHQVTAIDTRRGELALGDGTTVAYDRLVSTLPLQTAVGLAGVKVDEPPDPHTSVLVLNIGAERGPHAPDTHWQYEPDAEAGFHRLGWYSNVDRSFLPAAHRAAGDRVGLYVERAYVGGDPPSPDQRDAYRDETVAELQHRGYIGEVDVIDPSWVEVAYTWRRPGSTWRAQALAALEEVGVRQVGRYGIWRFQGIADSVADGLQVGEWLAGPTAGRR
jgi:protoporphyrinogen oxidase